MATPTLTCCLFSKLASSLNFSAFSSLVVKESEKGREAGKRGRTNLISNCRGKSVKKNELEDTDDFLESSVPTREYFNQRKEEKDKK